MKAKSVILRSSNFIQFQQNLQLLTDKEKGTAFELLTKLYLMIDPKYAIKLKDVYLYQEIPSALLKKLNLPTQDKGIDLIAETVDGEYWSVQCKYRTDENSSLTHTELSTFGSLSFVMAKGISFGLACTTTNSYSKEYKHQGKIGFCTSVVWHGLDKDFFEKAHAILSKSKVAVEKPRQPRNHQQRAIEEAKRHFLKEGNNRGKLIMPCGTGKSLAAFWIAEALQVQSVLIAVPSLFLVQQALKDWLTELSRQKRVVRYLCVCSDKSIKEPDSIIHNTQDLGIPVSTDVEYITNWFKKHKKRDDIKLIFTTYQSGKVLSESVRAAKYSVTEGIDVPNIDCILFADPKRSTVDIVQAVGRVLRTSPGKERGYIIIPVLVDDANPNSLLEDTAFQDPYLQLSLITSKISSNFDSTCPFVNLNILNPLYWRIRSLSSSCSFWILWISPFISMIKLYL
ncbi:MAG: DEAD/DEAH box helicase family protein [Leptospiraceae bacterium]|nr:DEAD/DEAH box helicase family protein [Leptospiraceae bacterium]